MKNLLHSFTHQLLLTGFILSLTGCATVTHQASNDFDTLRAAGKYTEAIQYAQDSIAKTCKDGNSPTCNEHKRVVLERVGDVYQYNLNRYAEAETTYQGLLPLYPQGNSAESRKRLQQLYLKLAEAQSSQGKTDEALSNTRTSYYLWTDELSRSVEDTYLQRLAEQNNLQSKLEIKKVRTFRSLWDDTWEARWMQAGATCPKGDELALAACKADQQAKWTQDFLQELDRKLGQHNYRDYYTFCLNTALMTAREKRAEMSRQQTTQNVIAAVATVATIAVVGEALRKQQSEERSQAILAQQRAAAAQQQQEAAERQQAVIAQQQAQQQAQWEQQRRVQEQQAQQQRQVQEQQRAQGQPDKDVSYCFSTTNRNNETVLVNNCDRELSVLHCGMEPYGQNSRSCATGGMMLAGVRPGHSITVSNQWGGYGRFFWAACSETNATGGQWTGTTLSYRCGTVYPK